MAADPVSRPIEEKTTLEEREEEEMDTHEGERSLNLKHNILNKSKIFLNVIKVAFASVTDLIWKQNIGKNTADESVILAGDVEEIDPITLSKKGPHSRVHMSNTFTSFTPNSNYVKLLFYIPQVFQIESGNDKKNPKKQERSTEVTPSEVLEKSHRNYQLQTP